MATEEVAPQGAGEENKESVREESREEKKIKYIWTIAKYFYDSSQGDETSRHINALLLPSGDVLYIKKKANERDQVFVKLNTRKPAFLKLWKDTKGYLLYTISSFSEPLFSYMKLLDFHGSAFSTTSESSSMSFINNDDNDITYEIEVFSDFFGDIAEQLNDMLAFALYHIYIKPLL